MRDYKRLKVWEKAHELVLEVYRSTQGFPANERYGLTPQIRRAAASLPANIAEGYGRSGDAELSRFLSIAQGSSSELSYHLLLARDLGYLESGEFDGLASRLDEVQKMMAALRRRTRRTA